MAKLPLITVVTPDSGPAKLEAIPKVEGGDSKGYYDTATGKVVVDKLIIDSLNAGILKTDVDGNVSSNTSIGHGEVDGLGALALLDAVDLADGEVTGVLGVDKGGTGKASVTAGSLLLGAGTGDMTELAGAANGHVVKWNASTSTWYSAAESGGGGGGGSVDSVTGTSPITVNNTDPANPVVGINQSALSIANTQVTGLGSLATKNSASLTADVTGTLPAGNGGTGLGAPASGNAGKVLAAKSDSTYELVDRVSSVGASGVLSSSGGTTPSISLTGTVGLGNGGTGSASNTGASGKVLVGNGSSAFVEQTMGGDATIGSTGSVTVQGLCGRTVSTATPANGQILVWSAGSSQWVPGASASGGSGGGGVTYYMNFGDTDNIGTTTNIPTNTTSTPNAPPYQLGRTSVGSTTTVTSAELGTVNMEHLCSFVTVSSPSTDPNIVNIPAGLWDFNIWARQISTQGGSGSALQSSFEVRVYKYSSGSVRTLLQSSDIIYIYDPMVVAQYIAQVNFPQTTILATDRIVVEIWGKAAVQNRAIELSFNGNTASHCHTTIPSVSGTGLVKVVNGSYQSPASLLVDADVDGAAAIAQSKISGLTTSLSGKVDTTRKVLGDGTTTSQSSTGALSADVTISMKDISAAKSALGSASKTVTITTDTYGRVTGLTEQSISGLAASVISSGVFGLAQGGLGTGSNTAGSGKILVGSGTAFVEQTMGGDATISSGGTLTLATLSPAVPTSAKGSATKSVTVTLNAKGLVTALSEQDIVLTSAGLPTNVAYKDVIQNFSAAQTFSGDVTLSSLTASRVLKLDFGGKVAADYIKDADVATNASIARDKLAVGTAVNSLIVNNGTDKKLSELAISATSGHVLKSNGTAATWGAIDVGSSNSVTGTLAATNGGTGQSTWTQGDILYASASNTLSKLSAGTAGYMLKTSGASANPSWAPVAYDIADRYTGLPTLNQVLTRFLAGRSFTLVAANTVCNSLVASSGATAAVLTLYRTRSGTKNAVGTITFSATSTGVVSSFNASYTSIQSGDIITLEMTTLDSGGTFASPYFTIGGYQV